MNNRASNEEAHIVQYILVIAPALPSCYINATVHSGSGTGIISRQADA